MRIVEPVLEAMGVPHDLFELAGDTPRIRPALDKAYAESWPTALLIGRRM